MENESSATGDNLTNHAAHADPTPEHTAAENDMLARQRLLNLGFTLQSGEQPIKEEEDE